MRPRAHCAHGIILVYLVEFAAGENSVPVGSASLAEQRQQRASGQRIRRSFGAGPVKQGRRYFRPTYDRVAQLAAAHPRRVNDRWQMYSRPGQVVTGERSAPVGKEHDEGVFGMAGASKRLDQHIDAAIQLADRFVILRQVGAHRRQVGQMAQRCHASWIMRTSSTRGHGRSLPEFTGARRGSL
ncbi:MAG: hypothetical protein JWQ16_1143 [Novosphingobium sp.]|nr:hypothetical protein [Novosphingobium sp.]